VPGGALVVYRATLWTPVPLPDPEQGRALLPRGPSRWPPESERPSARWMLLLWWASKEFPPGNQRRNAAPFERVVLPLVELFPYGMFICMFGIEITRRSSVRLAAPSAPRSPTKPPSPEQRHHHEPRSQRINSTKCPTSPTTYNTTTTSPSDLMCAVESDRMD
jgi:hypothetical protein